MKFKELGIIPPILKALEKQNYSEPTPIQQQAIIPILQGRDLLGSAQTGTGKTAAFAVPTLQRLSDSRPHGIHGHRKIRSLILTPTRELALQIFESFQDYGHYTGLHACVIFGGVSQVPQEQALKKGVDILVATPGRLDDLMQQGLVDLQHVEILTLDEADRMLDMGFIRDVKKIISKTPAVKQTLFFSATMPPEIAEMSKAMLIDPVRVSITPENPTVDAIEQSVYFVDRNNKRKLLLHLLKDPAIESALVFTRTKHGADRVTREMVKYKINAQAIHGDKSQGSRQNALHSFKDKKTRVLVATDIAARGLDIEDLSHVINFDLPNIPETYVHRIGRTGRAGNSGVSISFCDFDEKKLLVDIEKLIGKSVPQISSHPYPMLVFSPHPKPVQQQRRDPHPKPEQQQHRNPHQKDDRSDPKERQLFADKPIADSKSNSQDNTQKPAQISSNRGIAHKPAQTGKRDSSSFKRSDDSKPSPSAAFKTGKYRPDKRKEDGTQEKPKTEKLNQGKYNVKSAPKPKSNPGRYNQ